MKQKLASWIAHSWQHFCTVAVLAISLSVTSFVDALLKEIILREKFRAKIYIQLHKCKSH